MTATTTTHPQPWSLYGLQLSPEGIGQFHCPSCGSEITDDAGVGAEHCEPRFPLAGAQLRCGSCGSVGAAIYTSWAQSRLLELDLDRVWAEVLACLELPSTRMLLVQQSQLVAISEASATVKVQGIWLAMAQARLDLLQRAAEKVLPGRQVLLVAADADTQPQQQQLPLPAVDTDEVGHQVEPQQGEHQPPADQCTAAEVVVTDDANDDDLPEFAPGEEPRCRLIDGELVLPLTSWRVLHPDLVEGIGAKRLRHGYRLRFNRGPRELSGSSAYSAAELAAAVEAATGRRVHVESPRWRVRRSS